MRRSTLLWRLISGTGIYNLYNYYLRKLKMDSPSVNQSIASRSRRGSIISGGEDSIADSIVSTIAEGLSHSIAHWKILLFGQIISFFLAAAGAMSEELNSTCNIHIPLTQISLVGIVLMFLGGMKMSNWGCCLGCRRRGRKKTDVVSSDESEHFNCSQRTQTAINDGINNGEAEAEDRRLCAAGNDDTEWAADDNDDDRYSTKLSSRPRSFCFGMQTIHAPSWAYLILALVAVEGRFFVVLSFRYTSFTFIYLVQSLSMPSAMVFSKLFLKRKYLLTHVIGGLICIMGITLSTITDIKGFDDADNASLGLGRIKGDILAISGAILLGLDDVLSEEMVKHHGGVHEVLFCKWIWGVGIAVAQLLIFERESFMSLFHDDGTCGLSTQFVLLGLFTTFQVLDMAGEVNFLSISEACLLNLSLLSTNLYAAIFSAVTDLVFPAMSYLIALALVLLGIVLYEAGK